MPILESAGGGDERGSMGLPTKSSRPGGPPPGGGPGGGPGGIGFAPGGGFGKNAALFRGLASIGLDDAQLPVLLRKRGLALPPAPPGRGDTVPAMLTPGEKVIPANVAQSPQWGPVADQMIQDGRQQMAPGQAYGQAPMGFSGGGEVPQMCPHCGAMHFAFGGQVPNFGGMLGQRQPAQPMNNGLPRIGGFGAPPQQPGGMTRDSEGNVTNYDPNNPWANYQGNQNAFGLGLTWRGIGNAGAAGYFDPRGNQALINSQIEAAQGTKDALVRRQMTAADLYGLDPAQQAVAKLQAQREAGRGVQDIAANVRANAMNAQDQFYKNLYMQGAQSGLGYANNEQNARNERIAQQNAQTNANRFNPGAMIGQLGGAALGGYFGRPKQP